MPLALVVAVIAISFAGPFFRKTEPTHPLVAAGLRLTIAAACFLPWVLAARRAGRLSPRLLRAAALAGLFYGLHFGTWVWSLGLTTIAASVTLVTATPLLLAVAALRSGRDRPTRRLWFALGLAAVGVSAIGGYDFGTSPGALAGDALALLGAAAMAGYLLVARRLGPDYDLGAFSGVATAVGGASLLGTAALLGIAPVAASAEAWLFVGLATLVPQLVGHTLLTWSLRHTTPTVVAMATVAEPVGATLLAWLWLGEAVSGPVAAGAAATLAAVVVALQPASSSPSR